MKTWTHRYRDEDILRDFLAESGISDGPRLLVQVFCGIAESAFIVSLQKMLMRLLPHSVVIGATTDGSICDGRTVPGTETVLLFSHFEKTELQCSVCEMRDGDSFETGRRIGLEIGGDAALVITFSDGLNTNGEEYLGGLVSETGASIVAGGMASDNGAFVRTFVFTKEHLFDSGAVAVALKNPELGIFHDYTFNWMPIGKQMRITRAHKNRVIEIEGMPAAKVYGRYLGRDIEEQLPQVGVEFPLILERYGINVGRAVMRKEADNSLVFAGNIHENELVRFGVGNADVILNESDAAVRGMYAQPIEAIFVYSCMARRRFLGDDVDMELRPLQEKAPGGGFFTYGEFFFADGRAQLMNETMTVVGITENMEMLTCPVVLDERTKQTRRVNTMQALANLANVAAKELEMLNENLEDRVRENSQTIFEQLYTDRLTKLPNRTKLITKLGGYHYKYIILINVDDFTTLNDFYGHHVGDFVLMSLASWLQAYAEDAYVDVYRMPGDEFALVMKGEVGEQEIEEIVSNLSKKINALELVYRENVLHLSVTMSAAMIIPNGSGLAMADMTLKHAKRQNMRYLLHHDTMMFSDQYEKNLKMAKAIREAVKEGRIVPYFQPIMDLKTGEIAKFECLARLVETDGSIIAPFHFLPVAQQIRLYPEITRMIVNRAFKRFAGTDYRFTINLSMDDLTDPEMREFLCGHLRGSGMGARVTFEILETQRLEDSTLVMNFIKKVQKHGGTVAIDDFGSGFANFENLTRIEADYIKIDGSLIKSLDIDLNARIVVETIVAFAAKLGMKTVAEYVHSEEVLNVVKELGIDYAQGFLLGKPVPDLPGRAAEA